MEDCQKYKQIFNTPRRDTYTLKSLYSTITNPMTGGNIDINTSLGKKLIKQYINQLLMH